MTESSDLCEREIMSPSAKEVEGNAKCGESALACEKASGVSVGAVPPNCTRHSFSVARFKSLSTDSWTRNAPALRPQMTELINHMWVIVLLSAVLGK